MRTRGQVNAFREYAAQHRLATAALVAALERENAIGYRTRRSAPPIAPSRVATTATPSTVKVAAEEKATTPTKKTRKLPVLTSTSDGDRSAKKRQQHTPPPKEETSSSSMGISPVVRAAATRRRSADTPTDKKRAATTTNSSSMKKPMIRRTLDYATSDEQPSPPLSPQPMEVVEVKEEEPMQVTPEWILQRVASGHSNNDATASSAIVGRAEERQQIQKIFTSSAFANTSPATRALFVIGPPGTGKSSCVAQVASHHHNDATTVRLNCSTFTSPSLLFAAIGDKLHGRRSTIRLPLLEEDHQLEQFLHDTLHSSSSSSRNKPWVLVLDEVDHLVRLPPAMQLKAQLLLRFLVRWAHLPNAPLRFIGILNGVDMHKEIEAFLSQDPHPIGVVLFPSYGHEELTQILTQYIRHTTSTSSSHEVFETIEPRALELIARRIAAKDGDARRAVSVLQQCARSCLPTATIASQSSSTPVASTARHLTVRTVLQFTTTTIASQLTIVKQIQQLPRQPKLLLYAITRLAPCETATTTLNDVCEELLALQSNARLAWIPRPRQEEMQHHLGSLDCYALVKQTTSPPMKFKPRLAATVSMETLQKAFQDDELLKELPF